jgi:hypothetical protein
MTKTLTTILAAAFVTVSCSHGVSRIQTRSLPGPNPTTYSFALPLEEVHAKALEVFSIEHQIGQPVFGRYGLGFKSVLSVECATDTVFGKAVFRDPANGQDIYLHSFHSPFVTSAVYCGREGGLPFIATFHLHLTGSGSGTVVTVAASDTEVVNGTKFGIGPCGPGQANNYVRVKPTTVEEYSILRYLGSNLGVTNMPAVILPK